MKIQSQRLGDAVFLPVGSEVVMPLPDFAGERRFDINFDLLDIQWFAKDLLCGCEQLGMSNQPGIQIIAQMKPHGGTHLARTSLCNI